MHFRNLSFFSFVGLVWAACPDSQPRAAAGPSANVELRLVVASTTISQYDPLLVKVIAINKGSVPVSRGRQFNQIGGALKVEKRPLGTVSYASVHSHAVTNCGFPPLFGIMSQSTIPPGDRYVAYDMLSGSEPPGLSFEAGLFEVRATAQLGNETIASEQIRVQVNPTSAKDRKLLDTLGAPPSAPGFASLLSTFSATHPTPYLKEVRRLEAAVREGHLKRTLQRLIATQVLSEAISPAERNSALGTFSALYDQLDPVSAEAADLTLARHYLGTEDHARAEFHLNRVKDRSQVRDSLQSALYQGEALEIFPETIPTLRSRPQPLVP